MVIERAERQEGGRHCPSDHLGALLQPSGRVLCPSETWVPKRHRSKGKGREFRRINTKTRRLWGMESENTAILESLYY